MVTSLTMTLRGFADLVFGDSARLALARALEHTHSDVDQEHPSAWVVEDRRIVFSLEATVSRASFEAYRRLLDALVEAAESGEASLDVEGTGTGADRWARRAAGSGTQLSSGMTESDVAGAMPTIRTEAG